jgi:hypothetical protein
LLGIAVTLAGSSGHPLAQERHREQARSGPYRVVISKPIVGLGYTAGTLYREHEYLSAMFNELDAQGLTPIMTDVTTQTIDGRDPEQRMLVICRTR